MASDRAAELRRIKARQAMQRHRDRKAGLLPPVPACSNCGAKCLSDRWLPLCSVCTRRGGWGARAGHQASQVRLRAEQVIREIRGQA